MEVLRLPELTQEQGYKVRDKLNGSTFFDENDFFVATQNPNSVKLELETKDILFEEKKLDTRDQVLYYPLGRKFRDLLRNSGYIHKRKYEAYHPERKIELEAKLSDFVEMYDRFRNQSK